MATVLCLGVPVGAMVGIDLKSWAVGERFQGIRGIPIGSHYLYYAASDHESSNGISSGQFLYLDHDDDVLVFQWSSATEELLLLKDRDQAERYRIGVKQHDFDQNLGPYPIDMAPEWSSLSRHISKNCLRRLTPIGNIIHPSQAPGSIDCDAESAPRTYYTELKLDLPRRNPAEVTSSNLDKSLLLERLVEIRFGHDYDAVLGELQFCFVAFLLGQSFEGFEQWKKLIRLLCSCENAMWDQRIFFDKFIDAFSAQIRLAPGDFFECELTSNNFLYRCLTDLFELGQETCLEDKLNQFRHQAETKFNWRFGSQLNADGRFASDDEDAPVMVEL